MNRHDKRIIAVLDTETDPFLHGRPPKPFVLEFYTDIICEVFWGDDCIDRFCQWLQQQPERYLIYAHNGGKFDYHFFHEYMENPIKIIKNRIVEAKLYHHTLRDSYAIIPVGLGKFGKLKIDYNHLERLFREQYKQEILDYLHVDCTELYNLVTEFDRRFGTAMTIGSVAIKELQRFHPFRSQGSLQDQQFRDFYYGGRVQCFGAGLYNGGWVLVDTNSMYPHVMATSNHPINGRWSLRDTLPDTFDAPFFARVTARNRGALPSRAEDGSLTFDLEHGEFNVCSHELKVAMKYGLVDIEKVDYVFVSTEYTKFNRFVEHYGAEKMAAKDSDDKVWETFVKLILNSAYGRAGINPENFRDYVIHRDFGNDEQLETDRYNLVCDYPTFEIWERKPEINEKDYCDVAIAASITSAARAYLLENLQYAVDPIYCDTDSIICRSFSGELHRSRIGAWDTEVTSDNVVIAGKKMYAMYNDPKGDPKKISSKGGTVTLQEMLRMSEGQTIIKKQDAPSFTMVKTLLQEGAKKRKSNVIWLERKFKQTAR